MKRAAAALALAALGACTPGQTCLPHAEDGQRRALRAALASLADGRCGAPAPRALAGQVRALHAQRDSLFAQVEASPLSADLARVRAEAPAADCPEQAAAADDAAAVARAQARLALIEARIEEARRQLAVLARACA